MVRAGKLRLRHEISLLYARGLLAALVIPLSSCGSPPQATARHRPITTREAPPPVRETWTQFSEVSAWPALNAEPFIARGHVAHPGYADVRVSEEARAIYLNLVTDSVFPDGSTLALFFVDQSRTERHGVYAMRKAAGAWQFIATDAEGRLEPDVDGSACLRCHESAPADAAFGLPRSAKITAPAAPESASPASATSP